MKKTLVCLVSLVVAFSAAPLSAQVLFEEGFQGDLSGWVGKFGGSHQGSIVADPVGPGNRVLAFTGLNAGGDIFGAEVPVAAGQKYVLEFEYLGLTDPCPAEGDTSLNIGGYIGFAQSPGGGHRWLQGTELCCGAESADLIDDCRWHAYAVLFDPFVDINGNPWFPNGNTIHVMIEDFSGSNPIAGDALFDNVRLRIWQLPVAIDVKPGSDPNCVNINGQGVVPVAVFGGARFDVGEINLASLSFAGLQVRVRGKKGPLCSYEDLNGDGYAGLVCHFEDDPALWTIGNGTAELTGALQDGTPFSGRDSICVVPQP